MTIDAESIGAAQEDCANSVTVFFTFWLTFLLTSCLCADVPVVQDGDIIFQTSRSGQSQAIQLATHSSYSHVGIIFNEKPGPMVYEAVQPVRRTPLKTWIARGDHGTYLIKRLKDHSKLDGAVVARMKAEARRFLGKDYDWAFGWSDDKIYCSELVWKVYERGISVQVGRTKRLKDFDLSAKAVKAKLKQRYGAKIPLDETVISPADILLSDKLESVDVVR